MIQSAEDIKWKILREDKSIIPNYPRKTVVVLFKGLTGHKCLQDQLYRIGVVHSPNYVLCDSKQPMAFEHVYGCNEFFQFED